MSLSQIIQTNLNKFTFYKRKVKQQTDYYNRSKLHDEFIKFHIKTLGLNHNKYRNNLISYKNPLNPNKLIYYDDLYLYMNN